MPRPRGAGPAGPRVVVVTGAPGSGKSTLAERLAADLGVPLFAKDDVKTALYDALGADDADASRRLSIASFTVLGAIARAVYDGRGEAIVEANFTRGEAEPALRGACTHQVRVWCDPDENLRRYRERQRSPMHFDEVQIARLERGLREGWYEPLDLGAPTLEVETTAGLVPAYEQIEAFIRS